MTAVSSRISLDLVTGFLGSGKTTLINALLRDPAFSGAMVIVNEFGAVGVDHLLISSAQDNVVLLDSGCLCCAVSGTLRDTLIDLFARRASGALPGFNRVIVETSGLANPAPLVAALLGDSALTPRCALSQVLTLVDATTGLHVLGRYQEAQRQVAFADSLLISKTDTASPQQIDELSAALARFNPHVVVGRWQLTDSAAPHFMPAALPVPTQAARAANGLGRWLRGPLQPQYADDTQDTGAGLHSNSFQKITTQVLRVPQAVDWPTYAAWTSALQRRFHHRLLRCKGLLRMAPDNGLWVIQGVQGYFAPPQRLAHADQPNLAGFLVCIGEAIRQDELQECLGWRDDAPLPTAS